MSKDYAITYQAETVLGTRGFSYQIYCRGRLVAEGWSAGKRADAESDVRDTLRKREGRAA